MIQKSHSTCTNFRLRQLTRRVSQLYDAELALVGLKTTQYSLLSTVNRLGPIRLGDLAAMMTLDASTLSRSLKPLNGAGWVRIEAAKDARSRHAVITESGRRKYAQARPYWRKAQAAVEHRLGESEVAKLHKTLDRWMVRLEDPDRDEINA